jgi:hypothetical protein
VNVKRVGSILDENQAQVARALRASLSYLMKTLEAKAARELALDLQIPLKIARSRFRSFRNNRGNQALLSGSWHSLPAILLGKASRSGDGLKVGNRFFKGGFVARSSFSTKLPKRVFRRRTGKRFPLVEDRLDIKKEVSRSLDQVLGLAFDLFRKRFEHELRYRLKGGNPS